MKARSSLRQHDITPTRPASEPAKLASNVGGSSSANDDLHPARSERPVDPLLMVTVAMAVMFALLGLLLVST